MTISRLPDAPLVTSPEALQKWAEDMVEVTQGIFDDIIRNKQQLTAPTRMPIATVAELTSSAPKYKPSLDGGSRWVYAIDAFGGGIPVFADGTNWLRCDNRNTVT